MIGLVLLPHCLQAVQESQCIMDVIYPVSRVLEFPHEPGIEVLHPAAALARHNPAKG